MMREYNSKINKQCAVHIILLLTWIVNVLLLFPYDLLYLFKTWIEVNDKHPQTMFQRKWYVTIKFLHFCWPMKKKMKTNKLIAMSYFRPLHWCWFSCSYCMANKFNLSKNCFFSIVLIRSSDPMNLHCSKLMWYLC